MLTINHIKKLSDTYLSLINNVVDFDRFNQYAIVHHSNHIEGSTFSKEETFLLLDKGLTPKNKPVNDTLMAIDHLKAIQYVYKIAKTKQPLNLKIIQHLSSLILKTTGRTISNVLGTWDESKGEFRKGTVHAGTSTFVSYDKVIPMTKKLCDYINNNISYSDFETVNNLAFDAHFNLVSIHPFSDGNGRLSRLIMNYVQLYHNLPLSIIFEEDKSDYFETLILARKKEDNSIFRQFMYKQLAKHLKIEIKRLNPKKDTGFQLLF